MNFFQDSNLEMSSSIQNSLYSSSSSNCHTTPPLSSTPISTQVPPISVPPLRPKKILSLAAQEFIPYTNHQTSHHCSTGMNGYEGGNGYPKNVCMNMSGNGGVGGSILPPSLHTHCTLLNNATHHHQLILRQQQILHEKQLLQKQQQQEYAAATFAKQQFFLSAAHPQDEIANSLKMYAILAACNGNGETLSSSDEVMQDFAANGYTSDELNKYHQQNQVAAANAASNMQMLVNSSPFYNAPNLGPYDYNMNNTSSTINWIYNQQQYINAYNEIWRQNFFNILPTQLIRQAEVAAAACQNMRPPPPKRSLFKKDGQQVVRRCVFCENNNEPEAVVKSHAVRDGQGRVLCPKLRIYVCPICGASGDDAHTVKYCPQKPIVTMEDAMKAESNRFAKPNFVQKPPQMRV